MTQLRGRNLLNECEAVSLTWEFRGRTFTRSWSRRILLGSVRTLRASILLLYIEDRILTRTHAAWKHSLCDLAVICRGGRNTNDQSRSHRKTNTQPNTQSYVQGGPSTRSALEVCILAYFRNNRNGQGPVHGSQSACRSRIDRCDLPLGWDSGNTAGD